MRKEKGVLLDVYEKDLKLLEENPKKFWRGVTEIGTRAFSSSPLQNLTIPDGVTEIGTSAFQNCKSLQNVIIPRSVSIIAEYAFFECSSLQSVTIPDSITDIGFWAFVGCRSLQSVTIPKNARIWNDSFDPHTDIIRRKRSAETSQKHKSADDTHSHHQKFPQPETERVKHHFPPEREL